MRDRIHAGGGGQFCGQAQRQFGVANRAFGNDVRRMKPQLATIRDDDDGAPSNFAAGAAGGRNGYQRCCSRGDARGAAFNCGVAGQCADVGCRNGYTFGAINCRAAANRNLTIAASGLIQLACCQYCGFSRV